MRHRSRPGFTIVEFAIVALSLAILAALAIPPLTDQTPRSQQDLVVRLHQLANRQARYRTEHDRFTPDLRAVRPPGGTDYEFTLVRYEPDGYTVRATMPGTEIGEAAACTLRVESAPDDRAVTCDFSVRR